MAEQRVGFSLRGLQRRYGPAREWWAEQIRTGRLRAARTGRRRFIVLAADAEQCLRAYEIRPSTDAMTRVQGVRARDAAADEGQRSR